MRCATDPDEPDLRWQLRAVTLPENDGCLTSTSKWKHFRIVDIGFEYKIEVILKRFGQNATFRNDEHFVFATLDCLSDDKQPPLITEQLDINCS